MKIEDENASGNLANAIGKCLLANMVLQKPFTLSQMIEVRTTKPKHSDAPLWCCLAGYRCAPVDESKKRN